MKDWLHDCYFSAVAGDAPAFEAWPSQEDYMLHEYILALWGMPLGEMFDLEKLAKTCREKGRWTFFVTSKLNSRTPFLLEIVSTDARTLCTDDRFS